MPRNNSTAWNIADPITAARLNEINADVDDLYSTGSDRLKVWAITGLNIQIGAGNYRIGSAEGTYVGGTTTVTNNATNYVMMTAAGTINISTVGWNTNYLRLAKVIAVSGIITSVELWKPDGIGGVLGGSGFKNITSPVYDLYGLLTSFTADGTTYSLTYNNDGQPITITNGANIYTITYNDEGVITSVVES